MDPRKIGANVRRLRTNAKLSQEALAKKIECRQATISDIETGKHTPTIDTLMSIAKCFGVALTVLLG